MEVNRKELIGELKFLTSLLAKHEAANKEEKIKPSTIQQNCGNLLPQKLNSKQHPPLSPYKLAKNSFQPLTSFNQKYSLRKSNNLGIADKNKNTVLNNFKPNYILSKNQPSNYFSIADKDCLKRNVSNSGILSVPKKTVVCPEIRLCEASATSRDKFVKGNSHTKLIEEIESLTQLLKKKSSEKQPVNTVAKNGNKVQNKLPNIKNNTKNYNFSSSNRCNSVNGDIIFSKTKCLSNIPLKVNMDNVSACNNMKQNRNCYTKSNRSDKVCFNNSNPSKYVSLNKYCYKKIGNKSLNVKKTDFRINTVDNKSHSKNKLERSLSGSCMRKVISDYKNVLENVSSSSNTSVLTDKPNLTIKFNMTKDVVSLNSKSCKEPPNTVKVKLSSPVKVKSFSINKSSKMSRMKPASTKYTKINKHLITPNKTAQLRKSSVQKNISSKRINRKVNSKYKVINKTSKPCLNKKIINVLNSSKVAVNSPIAVDESESFFQELNDSTINELEKDLLAISTALTSTPVSSKTVLSNDKIHNYSLTKSHSKMYSKKLPLKKSNKRISKYKIVNSGTPQNCSLKKVHNFMHLKTGSKKVKYSKFSLVNKHIQPVHKLFPVRQEKSILVKRLFKSKNTIINKNTSPTNYSAKMIKSKYLTLNKRKFPGWQKNALYTKMPSPHQKLTGQYLRAKLPYLKNRYQKPAILTYHQKGSRKFSSYDCSTFSKQFSKNSTKNKYKRKLKGGYVHKPVVFIHGVRYSRNSSGKTLKKLPAKGQTTKTARRTVFVGKAYQRTPESFMRTSTPSNLANRVLHRSINRILTASTKKSLTKVNVYCMFYNRFGRCNRGVKCTYIHDPSKIAVCTRFLRGTCKVDRCPFSHEITPGKMAICSFFLLGACENENCPYRHEKLLPDAVLCKAFVQGYCPNGKECKKAHILICPKYIQGECDKGSSCAYPHPPKKVKKIVQKEEGDEEKKPDDVLLEKVARYFQPVEDCSLSCKNKSDENNISNRCVPKKRKKLESQPSYIPLFDTSIISHTS